MTSSSERLSLASAELGLKITDERVRPGDLAVVLGFSEADNKILVEAVGFEKSDDGARAVASMLFDIANAISLELPEIRKPGETHMQADTRIRRKAFNPVKTGPRKAER